MEPNTQQSLIEQEKREQEWNQRPDMLRVFSDKELTKYTLAPWWSICRQVTDPEARGHAKWKNIRVDPVIFNSIDPMYFLATVGPRTVRGSTLALRDKSLGYVARNMYWKKPAKLTQNVFTEGRKRSWPTVKPKMTDAEVVAALDLVYKKGECPKRTAKAYGVSVSHFYAILRGASRYQVGYDYPLTNPRGWGGKREGNFVPGRGYPGLDTEEAKAKAYKVYKEGGFDGLKKYHATCGLNIPFDAMRRTVERYAKKKERTLKTMALNDPRHPAHALVNTLPAKWRTPEFRAQALAKCDMEPARRCDPDYYVSKPPEPKKESPLAAMLREKLKKIGDK